MGIAHQIQLVDSLLENQAERMVGNAHPTMPDYRRYFVKGGSYFFTIVTYQRRPIFNNETNIQRLRNVTSKVKQELPFFINAAVILPDHMHFIWTLPNGDDNYSKRIGLIKARFTKIFHNTNRPSKSIARQASHSSSTSYQTPLSISPSRRKHRESNVWQRRFWEHTLTDEDDFERHANYIHYNPVKHGLVRCPHLWTATSFHKWVKLGYLDQNWGCSCDGRNTDNLVFPSQKFMGE